MVSGGASGIGRAIVQQLVLEGCHIAVCYVNETGLRPTVQLCRENNPHNVQLTASMCDVSDEAAVIQFAREAQENFRVSHINFLINNAGINAGINGGGKLR